jgi:phosphatidylethanolamine-binding protein (PEBP) family uncharacterized protein
VAQRTGAKRFLASTAKSASARVLLALALAAFALAGCGGGSSDSEAQGTASSATVASGADSGGSESQSKGAPGEKAQPDSQSASVSGGGDSSSSSPAADQKQGPRIAQPKGPPEQGATPAELANATVADMKLESPAIVASGGNPGSLSPTYSCDGKDSWPAMSWSGVPAGTVELALYAMNVQPVQGKLFVDWAVAGLDPSLAGIEEGKLPKGAVVATNGFGKRGYSICPQGRGEIYMFALYALPKRLGLAPGFDAREARAQILAISGNVGLLPALYAHG